MDVAQPARNSDDDGARHPPPLVDVGTVLGLLDASTCADDRVAREEGLAGLSHLETQPGFFSALVTIFSPENAEDIAEEKRMSAILYFKNACTRHWRRNSPTGPDEDEKARLRGRLLLSLQEPSDSVSNQYAMVLANLARQDYPMQWPDLFDTLIKGIEDADALVRSRAILYTYKAIKKIASRRLASQRKRFSPIAAGLFSPICDAFAAMHGAVRDELASLVATSHCGETEGEEVAELMSNIRYLLNTIKALRQLAANAILDIHEHEGVMEYLSKVPDTAQSFFDTVVALEAQETPPFAITEILTKLVKQLCKTMIDVQSIHPLSSGPLLEGILQFFIPFLQQPNSDKNELLELVTLKGMALIRNVVREPLYSQNKEPATQLESDAQQAVAAYLTGDSVIEFITILYTLYLGMNPEDRQGLEDDPNEYAAVDYGDGWQFNLFPCAEKLFGELISHNKGTASAHVVSILSHLNDLPSLDNVNAALNMLRLGAYTLYDFMNINDYTESLIHLYEAQNSIEGVGIQRRVLQVFAAWVPLRLDQDSRTLVYKLLSSALSDASPLFVRMEASATLTAVVNDVAFDLDYFKPFSEDLFQGICSFLATTNDSDHRLVIIDTLTNMINQVEEEASKLKESLVEYVPVLWQEATEAGNNLLIARIVDVVAALVTATGLGDGLDDVIVPIVQLGADVTSDASVYLLDNTLVLWKSYLENAPSCTEDIQELFPLVLPLLDLGDESLFMAMLIFNSYLLLAHEQLLSEPSIDIIISAFTTLLEAVPRREFQRFAEMVDLCLVVCPEDMVPRFTSVISRMVQRIDEMGEAYFTSATLTLLCRVSLRSPSAFSFMLSALGSDASEALVLLWDMCIDVFDSVTVKRWRKVIALAALAGIQSDDMRDELLPRMNELLSLIIGVVTQLHTIDGVRKPADSLVLDARYDDLSDSEAKRKYQVCSCDPVFTVPILDLFRDVVGELRERCGDSVFSGVQEEIGQQVADWME